MLSVLAGKCSVLRVDCLVQCLAQVSYSYVLVGEKLLNCTISQGTIKIQLCEEYNSLWF